MEESSERGRPAASAAVPRWVLAALFAVAVLYQTFENIRSDIFYLTPDKMHHILSAEAFLQGFGMSHVLADPRNLAKPLVEPHTLWSTGYSLLLALVLPLARDLYVALGLIDFFSTIVFFGAWWLITAETEPLTGTAGRLFILGWWALAHSPLGTSTMDASGSSDMLSIALFSLGIWFSLKLISGQGALKWALCSGICFGAAAGVRYAYWPLIVAGPLALLAVFRGKWSRAVSPALMQLGVSAAFVVYIMASQPSDAVHTIHDRVEKGFYWTQLSTIFPFPANAIGVFSALRSAGGHFGTDFLGLDGMAAFLWLFSIAMTAIAVWAAAVYLRGYYRANDTAREETAAAYVLETAVGAMAITLAMLWYLTIRVPEDFGWTYGSMPRYYMPAEMFLFLGLGAAFNQLWNRVRSSGSKAGMLALVCGLAVIAAGPLGHRAGRLHAMAAGVHPPSAYTVALKAFQREIGSLTGRGVPVVYADTDYERVLLAGMAGARMLQVEGPDDIPSLDRAEAILVAAVPRSGPDALCEPLLAGMRESGARIAHGNENFDLLILDLSNGLGP